MGMTDKQYDGMIKDQIASLDRIAKVTKDLETLKTIYEERKLAISKLGYDIEENGLYDRIKQ
jgi:lipopolysaccharide biosynthesis regulator YciM